LSHSPAAPVGPSKSTASARAPSTACRNPGPGARWVAGTGACAAAGGPVGTRCEPSFRLGERRSA